MEERDVRFERKQKNPPHDNVIMRISTVEERDDRFERKQKNHLMITS